MIPPDRIGHLDQVALVSERPPLDVRVLGGIDLRLHPERGFDIGAAWFRGAPLAWIAAAGEGGSSGRDWRATWGGGLVTTCGLDNVGAPSEGIGLHGGYTFLEATEVRTERCEQAIVCSATVADPRGLRVERAIRTLVGTGRVELVDRTVNVSSVGLEAPLLYHVNFGWPLWDVGSRVESDATEVRIRDEGARGHDWREGPAVETTTSERVWEHLGATRASVTNSRLGLRATVESSLPRLWQWIDPNPGIYVLSLEPANCSVRGRAHDRGEGRLPELRPGEDRTTSLALTVEELEPAPGRSAQACRF